MEQPKKKKVGRPFTAETARELGRKGAIKSNQVQKAKKEYRERLKDLLAMKVDAKLKKKLEAQFGIPEGDNLDLLMVAAFKLAVDGNMNAINNILEHAKIIEPKNSEVNINVDKPKNIMIFNGKEVEI